MFDGDGTLMYHGLQFRLGSNVSKCSSKAPTTPPLVRAEMAMSLTPLLSMQTFRGLFLTEVAQRLYAITTANSSSSLIGRAKRIRWARLLPKSKHHRCLLASFYWKDRNRRP